MKKVLFTIMVTLALVAFVACSNPTVQQNLNNLKTEGDAAKTANLVGSTWKWTETSPSSDPSTSTEPTVTEYNVTFKEDGTVDATTTDATTGQEVPATDFNHTDFVVFRDKVYFEAKHDDDSDFFDVDDFEYYIDSTGKLVVDDFVDDLFDVDDELENMADFDDDEIPFEPNTPGSTNGREGTWKFSFADRSNVTTTITLVVSSDEIDVVSEKTLSDGSSQPEMLATYSYVEEVDDDDNDDDDNDRFFGDDQDDGNDDVNEPNKIKLKVTPKHVYLGYYFDDDLTDDDDYDDDGDDDDDEIRFTRDGVTITIERDDD